jgi:hypothetical protein
MGDAEKNVALLKGEAQNFSVEAKRQVIMT